MIAYGLNCTLPLANLTVLRNAEQWAWVIFDVMGCAAIFSVACHQLVQKRINFTHRREVNPTAQMSSKIMSSSPSVPVAPGLRFLKGAPVLVTEGA